MGPSKRVYVGPAVTLVLFLVAGWLCLRWNDVTGVLIVIVGLCGVVGMFLRARRQSITIQMDELRAAERRPPTGLSAE